MLPTKDIRAALAAPVLSATEQAALVRRWRSGGDLAARNRLIVAYLRFAYRLAGQYAAVYGLPACDLRGAAVVGLTMAIDRYDPERAAIATYAGWWVHAALREYVLANMSIVRPPSGERAKTLFWAFGKLHRALARGGGEPSRAAMVDAGIALYGLDQRAAERIVAVRSAADPSLDTPLPSGVAAGARLASDDDTPEAVVVTRCTRLRERRALRAVFATLSERERVIIAARCLRDEPVTLKTLARHYGVTHERVRQIEEGAKRRLRERAARALERGPQAVQARGEPALC
ncbi:MAG TPA: sigma-70 family RNA polymerase sigma factor [Azospirillum sp.]